MRKLYRSRTNRKLAGVIGGISQYIGIDASLLRVLFIISLFFTVGTPGHFIYDFCVFSSK